MKTGTRQFVALAFLAGLLLGGCRDQGDLSAAPAPDTGSQQAMIQLGEQIFFDTRLSEPAGQSCAGCHNPLRAFTDPDDDVPTSEGIIPGRFGIRNTPQVAYAAFSPSFHFDAEEALWFGGQFLDGRADTLEEQARQPFFNPLEMNNPDERTLAHKLRTADYAPLLESLFGKDVLDDDSRLVTAAVTAIAAFERSDQVSPFSSKYDAWLRGEATLSAQELRGLALFNDPNKGNCAACHPSQPAPDGTPPLFTDFSYDNLGVPVNVGNPFYDNHTAVVADAATSVDRGLGDTIRSLQAQGRLPASAPAPELEDGKFKVPSLRNVAVTPPYMHNGIFTTLRQVVAFYNSRDVMPARWGAPEVPSTVNTSELGNLGLTEQEVDDIVAFLKTLTDGYAPES